MPSELETAARRFKADLLQRERSAASAMVRVYGRAWNNLSADIDALSGWIDSERRLGNEVKDWRVRQLESFRNLRRQVEAEIREFSGYAEQATLTGQRTAVEAAFDNAADLIQIGAGRTGIPLGVVRFNPGAVESFVGFASNGSPLRDLFAELGDADAITDNLVANLVAGVSPRVAARLLRIDFAVPLQRALRINRTEMIRAYRSASMDTYRLNAENLDGWVWLSAADSRTCAACFAMHGTIHKLDEDLNDHVQGRCTAVPLVRGKRSEIRSGDQEFADLSEADQRRVLGATAFEAYQEGSVKISHLATTVRNPRWGDSIRRKTLDELGLVDVRKKKTPAPKKTKKATTAPTAAPEPALKPVPRFQTAKEAEQWAKDNIPGITVDYKGLAPEVYNEINAGLYETTQRFPGIESRIRYVGSSQQRNREIKAAWSAKWEAQERARMEKYLRNADGTISDRDKKYIDAYIKKRQNRVAGKVPGNTFAWSATSGDYPEFNGISFNEKWSKDVADLTKTMERNGPKPVGSGWLTVGSVRGTVDHELGHEIDKFLGLRRDRNILDIIDATRQMTGGVVENVSRYATTNEAEFIAETWTEFVNSPSPREPAVRVGEYILSLAKRKQTGGNP